MGAVSVSIGRPSRRSRSSSFAASATTSGPMPSPGRRANFTGGIRRSREPRPIGQMLRLERADLVRVLERQADFVQAVEQAMLAKGFDVEAERLRAVGRGDGLARQIDRERKTRERLRLVKQPVDLVLGQYDRQQTVLEAVVEKDVGEGWRDDGPNAVVEQRPGCVLTRAAATEVPPHQQDLRAPVTRLVQRELRVEPALRVVHPGLAAIEVAPRVEQVRPETGTVDRLEELLRDDDVGVDVGTVERSHQSGQDAKG